jgi:benzodiazapine receptor
MARMSRTAPTPLSKSWKYVLLAAALVTITSLVGGAATGPRIPTWYAQLEKPFFTPPNAAFPIAWTLLFTLMAVSFQRILRMEDAGPIRTRAIVLFCAQLVLNALWSIVFFGLTSPLLGLVVIVPFLGLIVATIVVFARIDATAAWLLAPYPLWVAFATVLNAAIVKLN